MLRAGVLGPWHIAVKRCYNRPGYVAWAAQTPDLGFNPLDCSPQTDVYFDFADTAEEAVEAVRNQVRRLNYDDAIPGTQITLIN